MVLFEERHDGAAASGASVPTVGLIDFSFGRASTRRQVSPVACRCPLDHNFPESRSNSSMSLQGKWHPRPGSVVVDQSQPSMNVSLEVLVDTSISICPAVLLCKKAHHPIKAGRQLQ